MRIILNGADLPISVPRYGTVSYTHLDVYKRQTRTGYVVDISEKAEYDVTKMKSIAGIVAGSVTADSRIISPVSYTHLDDGRVPADDGTERVISQRNHQSRKTGKKAPVDVYKRQGTDWYCLCCTGIP